MSRRPEELSLFNVGPFHQLQVFLGLLRPPNNNIPRRVVAILAIVWLPLVIITALTNVDQLSSLLRDYVVYSRMVLAVPALLIGQLAMDGRFRTLVTHVRDAGLLDTEEEQQFNGLIAKMKRPRDSALAEIIIVTLVAVELLAVGPARVARGSAWASMGEAGARIAPAGWYYLIVSVPIYQFLLLLNIWKWVVWSYLLFRLSRMHLQLVATHPDEHGGLGFLGLAPAGFIPTAAALATTIGGAWRYEMLHDGARLMSFAVPAGVLLVFVFLFELGPLCFFVPKLGQVRSTALLEYGVLAQTHVKYFQQKWIAPKAPREHGRLNAGDVANLALYGASYDRIKNMRPLPIDRGMLIGLALSVVLPLFPVVLAEIPLSEIARAIFKAVGSSPF